MMFYTDRATAELFVNVVLSIGRISGERFDNDNITASSSDIAPTLTGLDEISDALGTVERRVADIEGHAGEYMRGMTRAVRYFLRTLQGDKIPYVELIDAIQQVPAAEIPASESEELKSRLADALGAAGYRGALAEQVKAWLADTVIPPDDVAPRARAYVERAKRDTLGRVVKLPADDQIDSISPVRGVFWSAYSKYSANGHGTIRLNIDRPWPEPVLQHILCHESYPGHQAFYCLWDYLYKDDEWPLEASFYFSCSPTNALFEGAPENGLHFLGWDTDNNDEPAVKTLTLARHYMDIGRIAQTNAAYFVNTGAMDRDGALAYMQREGLISAVEAANAYNFFTHPVQAAYYPSYYYGRRLIRLAYEATAGKHDEFFAALYRKPQTTETLINDIARISGKPFEPFKR